MANIATLLNTIKNAVYGKDMRLALHDAIKATNDDVETKEPNIASGTIAQYWRGDKTWQNLSASIKNTSLAGLSTSNNGIITSLDTVLIAFGKLQAQMNTTERSANKGVANGYAGLDSAGKVPVGQLPDIAITDTFVVSSQSAMLALTAQIGDVAVRTDLNKSFILKALPSTTLANWQELLTPTDAVLSVNGKTGVVALTKADVGLSNVDNTADSSKNVFSASKLTWARTINGVSFDGTASITIYDNTKEPNIASGTTAQYWRGDKTWQDLMTAVRNTVLTGLSTSTNAAISDSNTAIQAFGRLQAQITSRLPLSGGTMTGSIDMGSNKITSSATPSTDNDYTNKKYVDVSVENLQDTVESKLMEATSVSQTIEDSIGSSLLDSNGDTILGSVTLIDMVAKVNEAIERLNTHALLDSTF